jgi:hypothetical protein
LKGNLKFQSGIKQVRHKEIENRRILSFIAAISLTLAISFVIKAQPTESVRPASPVTAVAATRSIAELLPDKIAGMKATSAVKEYAGDNLAELVADKGAVYQEYLVARAASRKYAETRVDIFETENQFAAFGLFTYSFGKNVSEEIGSGRAMVEGGLVFWKGNYFVRVMNANSQMVRARGAVNDSLARAISDEINLKNAPARPALLESLPAGSILPHSERYFLGPDSLNAYVERGREMFGFAGDAEAVMAEYDAAAPVTEPGGTESRGTESRGTEPSISARARLSRSKEPRALLKLVIVEYHTPQFASDAFARVNDYIATLPEPEQSRIIVKREGNYIVEVNNFENREAAQALLNAVKYPYGVKWLRDPRLPSNDPFRIQKAAQMLLSTFVLLGLILLTVVVGGGIVGTSIFLKRRKQQQEVFSNAGGMLRLELDPFETTLLGLPPKSSDR